MRENHSATAVPLEAKLVQGVPERNGVQGERTAQVDIMFIW